MQIPHVQSLKENNSTYTCFILVIQHFIDKNKLFKRKYYYIFYSNCILHPYGSSSFNLQTMVTCPKFSYELSIFKVFFLYQILFQNNIIFYFYIATTFFFIAILNSHIYWTWREITYLLHSQLIGDVCVLHSKTIVLRFQIPV